MHLSGKYPCYRVYPAADGWLTVGRSEPQFWTALCTAIEREDLRGDAFASGDRRSGSDRRARDTVRDQDAGRMDGGSSTGWMFASGRSTISRRRSSTSSSRHRQMFCADEVPGIGSVDPHRQPDQAVTARRGTCTRIPPTEDGRAHR